MPYPGRGHINPMMNLCKSLVSKSNRVNIIVTFVVTEEWLGFIGSETKQASIRFGPIPNVLPSELIRAGDMLRFVEATMTKMEEPFERLLDRLDPPVSIIIADTFLPWAVDVGNRRNIPVASFLADAGVERGEELVDYIPGLWPARLANLPTILHSEDQTLLLRALDLTFQVTKAQYLLSTSIFELEAPVFSALQAKYPFPVYSFGPLIPCFNLQPNASINTCHNESDYLKWLDSQPESSVLYVSTGSFLSISSAQMEEMAAGFRDSGVRYLWVARDKMSRLKEDCGEAGMVVPWCDQLKVLCHSSVGGFWTHCGWNSTLESVFARVPMLALPLSMDQFLSSKFVVEDWKIGWRVRKERDLECLVRREEIAELVRAFMDSKSAVRKEMMTRAKEIHGTCRRAIENGGSSETNLHAFIKDITK
ncbi:UDP-Glycosyltransferase superfamily protein [Actinidia rufa]|uniref:UDP-Glycosyltransferase superfamily protein n=1 Tax=Actinidia rufa TaxID=165716 RepID=A0A7J0HAS7_9ERIC|nr:UDP-Glycosyltransferase superfamily protein [Actinidia rufa]